MSEQDLFRLEANALERAHVLGAEYEARQLAKIASKEKPTKDWAWHIHYHRREIRRHEKEIECHRAKLAVAKEKVGDE